MLSIEKYLSYIFEVVRISAQLEELKRIQVAVPLNSTIQQRTDFLYRKRDKIKGILDKEHKPIEIAPVEQYIDIELKFAE